MEQLPSAPEEGEARKRSDLLECGEELELDPPNERGRGVPGGLRQEDE